MLSGGGAWCFKRNERANLGRVGRAVVRTMCGQSVVDRGTTGGWMDVLGLGKTVDWLVMVGGVGWCEHVLRGGWQWCFWGCSWSWDE